VRGLRFLSRLGAGLLGVWLACTAGAQPAAAQTTSSTGTGSTTTTGCEGGTNTLVSVEDPTRNIDPRPADNCPLCISARDCEDDAVLRFAVTISSPPSGSTLEVWLGDGDDCFLAENRDDGLCAQVWSEDARTSQSVELSARALANIVTGDDCNDTGGDSTGYELNLHFLVVTDDSAPLDPADGCNYSGTRLDLLGPPPPTDVVALIQEGSLQLNFTPSSDSDVAGYDVYCTEAGGTPPANTGGGGVGGGGVGGGAGGSGADTAGGTGGGSGCPNSVLVEGDYPPTADSYLKGHSTSFPVVAAGLQNEVQYACAIAATDDLENPGTLSEVVCGTAFPTDDFFTVYQRAGGLAGGGICSIGADPKAYAAVTGGLGFTLLAFFARRRRRSTKRNHIGGGRAGE
jgi:hypothetical protein